MARKEVESCPVDPVNGPCYYNKPGWENQMCPIAKTVCQSERCLAFEYKVPDEQGRGQWFETVGARGKIVHCQCNALNTIFQTWDFKYVQEKLKAMHGDGKDEGEPTERPA